MTSAELWAAWRLWMTVGAAVVLVAAALLVTIWLTARSIAEHATRALRAAEAYRTEILPRTEEAVRLYEAKFKEAAAAYPQVLSARRAHQEARVEYLEAAGEAWRHHVLLEGLLLEGGLAPPGAPTAHAAEGPDLGGME